MQVEGIGFLCRPAENYPNPDNDPRSVAITRRVFASDKKFGIKRSLVCPRSRYGISFRYGVIIVACVIRQIRSRDYEESRRSRTTLPRCN